jgi:outer membrane receptor protein involved in Fe transport
VGELDRRRIDGAVCGPILPGLVSFRLSGLDEERDGYLRNTTAAVLAAAASPIGFRERRGVRAQLGFPNVFGASFVASYEKAEAELSAPWAFRQVLPKLEDFFRGYDPRTDFDGENLVTSIDLTGFSRRTLDRFILSGAYPFGAGWELGLTGEASALDFRSTGDTDFTPVDMFKTRITDDNPQKTAELRASSPNLAGLLGLSRLFGFGLGASEITGGFFFQRREIRKSELAIGLNTSNVAAFAAAQNAPDPSGDPPNFAVPPDIVAALELAEDEEETTGFFEQRSDTWAPFAHLIWNVHGPWTIEHGMRFTWEKKTGSVENAFTKGTGIAFQALLAAEEFQSDLALDEFAFTPKEVLRYDWSDDVGFFASWAKGFKAGGFNELSVNNDNNLTFDREETNSWELGTKTRLLEGLATLNLTLFWQEVENLQVFVVDPDAMLVSVRNAGEARSRGIELDSSWLATDWLTFVGTAGYLDAKYLDFPFGTCAADRPDTDGSGDGFCDLSGEQATHTPQWMAALTSSVRYPLGGLAPDTNVLPGFLSALDLTGGLTIEYNDVQFADQSNDFRMRQPSYVKLRASLGVGDEARGWALGITGENLTDVVTVSQTRDVPLGGGNIVQVQEAPRLFFGTFRWEF